MSEHIPMTRERFESLIEAYGGDLARWPHSERLAAYAFAQSTPEAAALLADGKALDRLLSSLPVPSLPETLKTRILASASNEKILARPRGILTLVESALSQLWPHARVWKPASVFASALALGAALGFSLWGHYASHDQLGSEDLIAYAVPTLAQDIY